MKTWLKEQWRTGALFPYIIVAIWIIGGVVVYLKNGW